MQSQGSFFNLDRVVAGRLQQEQPDTYKQVYGGKNETKETQDATKKPKSSKKRTPSVLSTDPLMYYLEVPKSLWHQIDDQTTIRYQSNGELKTACRIKKIQKNAQGNYTLTCIHFHHHKTYQWTISITNIEALYIYAKITAKTTENTKQLIDKIKSYQGNTTKTMSISDAVPQGGVLSKRVYDRTTKTYTSLHDEQPTHGGALNQFDTSDAESPMEQLGNKLLFGDLDVVTARIDHMEVRMQKNEDDLKRIFLLVKKMYQKIYQT